MIVDFTVIVTATCVLRSCEGARASCALSGSIAGFDLHASLVPFHDVAGSPQRMSKAARRRWRRKGLCLQPEALDDLASGLVSRPPYRTFAIR